ncbi:FadR/GntR family transcriptional regulator [Heyndrickxia oleronia]|jgi:GntR family transcriptional repressor for pyruvate dehydrogenase complex|uniref:FadR/GntR family transcriptional regulator n=1 Tax=Heyndrickxia oleronia TaxID=38875 RepID=UPI0009040312|nr:FadR/GntR family transcriptional regulator [Heyndrickxia oleronia]OJH20804.1 GntR family transcriptional regulator [Bacillus obstructivus]MBU5211523.1 FadR family transcriptional regulator [Heyndrickxia oleronia]MCI1589089.1 FadR family transcriptional regulator [Heyndrickxia oleronia]MCI1611819.1 FadR family transcriptional regulator [Heyndrickxia oleronia]MCI1743174.1 FadR family transcriptional regulator [Heyndrickxia oleronia]
MEPISTLERKSLKKMVIQEIKQYIIDHQLKAGDQLPTERKFTELFGVSRSVVREALSFLENTDVIRIRQGHGAFLNESNIENLLDNFFFLWQINSGKIQEILGLRILFESSAIDEIVKANRREDLNDLKKLVEESEQATTPDEFREADILFHKLLLQATNNGLFIQMTNMITSYFFQVQHIQITHEEYRIIVDEHRSIIEALLNGDADEAKGLLTKHIKNIRV